MNLNDIINIGFKNCDVKIEKMLDIHDNGKVIVMNGYEAKSVKEEIFGDEEEEGPVEDRDLCVALNSRQKQVLIKAELSGIIVYNEGRKGYDVAEGSSNALVAYLCGKLFCRDYEEEGLWKAGSRFEDAQYCQQLFGFDVAVTRRIIQGSGAGKAPKGYDRVEKIMKIAQKNN